MNCAYCDAVMPDGVEVCPECGKPVDNTGLGGTLKFFDMKSNVRSSGIISVIFSAVLIAAAIWEFRSFFRFGFSYHNFGLIEVVVSAVFIAGIVIAVYGILHIKNAGRCYFSIKNHGVKAAYTTVFGTINYLECKYEDISYAYIAKIGRHSIIKIGTHDGEHKIRGLNILDEQFISSQINTALSTPVENDTENE